MNTDVPSSNLKEDWPSLKFNIFKFPQLIILSKFNFDNSSPVDFYAVIYRCKQKISNL